MGSPEKEPKARYVAQGHKDRDKHFIVHNLSTLRQRSTRIVALPSAVCGFRIFAHDGIQSDLQSAEKISRHVYLDPRPEDRHFFGIQDDEVLQLLGPLHDICGAGDYWAATMVAHIQNDLGMESTRGDPALFIKTVPASIEGLLGTYIDDSILGGGKAFQKLTERTLRHFHAKPRQ